MNNKTNSRVLELTIISAESLSRAGNSRIKKNTYVVINPESSNDHTASFATAIDTENGSYPFWNQKFHVDMPMHASFFTLEVRCKNSSGDHAVGSVRVPVSDFTSWYFPRNYLHFLSYRLKDRDGGRNGVINLSVKVKSPENVVGDGGSKAYLLPAKGWEYGGASMGQGGSNGTVIGVPCGY
ncbi:hypothetical protein SSX86_012396 [Deinandra increscens subsp. villosa]|uniref:C2 domain-containing protein n=1 Tax=Deinandra increscens subsp. villosa TaxID=3103831 RepID=A0AAP0D8M2_9ASTR